MSSKSDVAVDVRPYREEDEPGVLDLLSASLGGGPVGERRPEFFRWKHFDNPFGSSFMLVAETDDRIVGLRAYMRWRFEDGTRILHAVRAVDTATHPDYQRRGIFSRLTKQALEELREDVDLVFNTPNETSLRGYLKMGWDVVGKVPIWVKVRRPLRLMTRGRTIRETMDAPTETPHVRADPAEVGLGDGAEISSLLSRIKVEDGRLRTLDGCELLALEVRGRSVPRLSDRPGRDRRRPARPRDLPSPTTWPPSRVDRCGTDRVSGRWPVDAATPAKGCGRVPRRPHDVPPPHLVAIQEGAAMGAPSSAGRYDVRRQPIEARAAT